MAVPALSTFQQIIFAVLFVFQAGFSEFLVGVIFQWVYRRTGQSEGNVVGDMTIRQL
jgi:hypothetical protein